MESVESLEERLYIAVTKEDLSAVTHLLKQGANVNHICSSGRTPLGTAAQLDNSTILGALLDASRSRQTQCMKEDSEWEQNWSSSGGGHGLGSRKHRCKKKKVKREKDTRSSDESMTEQLVESPSQNVRQNMGYFVFVHDSVVSPGATKPTVEDVGNSEQQSVEDENCNCRRTVGTPEDGRTPDGMDGLEWDSEVTGGECAGEGKPTDREEEKWASLYRWYADILDRTGPVLHPSAVSVHRHGQPKCEADGLDVYGRSAVHYAAEQGHIGALKMLLSAGCRVDVGDTDNVTPLHLAAARDHPEAVALLLSCGAKVNRRTAGDRTSALHLAASRGLRDVVAALLAGGANVDAPDASDRTPLMLAAARGHCETVDQLIREGARINTEEIHGYTPLCEAVWKGSVGVVRSLLGAGARITQSHHLLHHSVLGRQGAEAASLLLQAGCVANLRDDSGDTPLLLAARTGQVDVARVLIRNGASVNYPNGLTGSSPLHEAVESSQTALFSSFLSMFSVLRGDGAPFSSLSYKNTVARLDTETVTTGDTPLSRALLLKRHQIAALLIRHGCDVNHGGIYSSWGAPGGDHLSIAKARGLVNLVRLLVKAGFDLSKASWLPDYKALQSTSNQEVSDVDAITIWLLEAKHNPMPLVDLCRLIIRKRLGDKVAYAVSSSGLPKPLKMFLMLEDIDDDGRTEEYQENVFMKMKSE
ncbi:ankyrin repeat and KH domain-containing protein mask-like [Ischnura elegans]|uniref:ankyrin repeat and KH domain-containing protein mask-like n=1 Tax=Ischnura elegans TaxID=197161 RepID=UPI001ED88B3D|nr:ankyrin repeat and KH domain-containing protein mask-like [Ischnura elegans]